LSNTIWHRIFKNPALLGFFSFVLKVFFWSILLQWIGRCLFLALKGAFHQLTVQEFFHTFLAGFTLDLAFVSYFLVFSIFMFWLGKSLHEKISRVLFIAVGTLFIQITIILSLADAEMFAAWGSKFNRQALQYLYSPNEAAASSSEAQWTGIIISWIAFTLLFFRYLTVLAKCIVKYPQTPVQHLLTACKSILTAAIFIIPIRGGFGNIPINQSVAVFSANPAANMAAINSGWNFLYYLINKNDNIDVESYHFYRSGDDGKLLNHYFNDTVANIPLSHISQPNVCIVIMESFSAYGSQYLTGSNKAMPFMDSMQETGFCLKRAYASGDRTDKGLAAVISAWHGQPWQSILHEPDKAAKLPSLAKLFNEKGYKSSFLYGGDLGFANMRSYLYASGFQTVRDQSNFISTEITSKWGAHDEFAFNKLLKINTDEKGPFFHVLLTLSSHEPYDVPGGPYFKGKSQQKELLNSIGYTDECVRHFMAEASKTTWFKNTLFVFVADHGRDLGYPETQFDRPGHFHIPLFFWGPALHPILSGKSSVKVASQCDIAETLNQSLLFNKKKQFDYAANLLNNNRHSPSVYIFNSGFGVVAEDGEVVFHNQPRQKTLSRGREKLCDSLLSLGQVFQYRQIVNYMKN
jgi:phosphoglycerol transferase MdoB-like AlkP superfamily enzyme